MRRRLPDNEFIWEVANYLGCSYARVQSALSGREKFSKNNFSKLKGYKYSIAELEEMYKKYADRKLTDEKMKYKLLTAIEIDERNARRKLSGWSGLDIKEISLMTSRLTDDEILYIIKRMGENATNRYKNK